MNSNWYKSRKQSWQSRIKRKYKYGVKTTVTKIEREWSNCLLNLSWEWLMVEKWNIESIKKYPLPRRPTKPIKCAAIWRAIQNEKPSWEKHAIRTYKLHSHLQSNNQLPKLMKSLSASFRKRPKKTALSLLTYLSLKAAINEVTALKLSVLASINDID